MTDKIEPKFKLGERVRVRHPDKQHPFKMTIEIITLLDERFFYSERGCMNCAKVHEEKYLETIAEGESEMIEVGDEVYVWNGWDFKMVLVDIFEIPEDEGGDYNDGSWEDGDGDTHFRPELSWVENKDGVHYDIPLKHMYKKTKTDLKKAIDFIEKSKETYFNKIEEKIEKEKCMRTSKINSMQVQKLELQKLMEEMDD